MIDISGRAMRAGTRGIAVLAAAAGLAVMPQLAYHQAHAARAANHHPHPRAQARHEHQGRRALVQLDTRAPHGAIVPGRTYRWPYSVTNNGDSPVRDVTFATTPDRDLKVIAAPPRCAWRRGAVLVCRVGLIPRGQTRRGSITATVRRGARIGKSLSSPAQLSWRGTPANARTTRAAAFPPVAVSPATDLSVRSTAPGQVGSSDAPYEISVSNDGPVTAESVVVRGAVAPDGPCASGQCPDQRMSAPVQRCGTDACGKSAPDACGCQRPRPAGEDLRRAGEDLRREAAPCEAASCAGAPNGSCAPCSARPAGDLGSPVVPRDDRPAGTCGNAARSCGAGGCVGHGSCGAPVIPDAAPVHGKAAETVSIRHHRRCLAQGTGFVCPIGSIPPGKSRTLRLAVHARPGAPVRRFRCLSTVESETPDSNMANNRATCHTRLARPVAVRHNAPVRHSAPARHLPMTGGAFDEMALWGLGLSGVGLALFALGRRRRGQRAA